MHGGAAPNLPLDRFAAITSLIDIGRLREDVLRAAELSADGWLREQEAWLGKMASQARLQRFDLQVRFNTMLIEMLTALERGERVAVSESKALGKRGDAEAPGAQDESASSSPPLPGGVSAPAVVPMPPPPPPAAIAATPAPATPAAAVVALTPVPPSRASEQAPASVRPLPPPPAPAAAVAPPPPPAAVAAPPGPAAAVAPPPAPVVAAPAAALPFPAAPPPPATPAQRTAAPADGALPFAGAASASSGPSSSRGAGLPFRAADLVAPPPPVKIETPHVDLGKTLGPGEVISPLREPPAAAVDLGRTMMADDAAVARAALPFAGAKKNVTLPFRAVSSSSARPEDPARAADGALPFAAAGQARSSAAPAAASAAPAAASSAPATASTAVAEQAEQPDPGDELARTVVRGKGPSAKRDEPRLTLEQFASLTAEAGVHPERRSEIEARYGLDARSHDLEKRAWALIFFDDRAAADRYTAKVKEFRQWLEKGSAT